MTWTRGPTIGRGSTATVSIATTSAGDIFAVKSTDLASSALLKKEESFLSQLSSPHIIRCLGSDCDRYDYNLFLEYSGGGSLSDLIGKRGGSLDEKSIRFYSRQLVAGLEYLHRSGLVHCDIKGQNILVGDGVKIADFGCAKWAGSDAVFSGTPAYMAPEVCRGEEQGFAADVWAAGCTVVEMATGQHPWPEMKAPAAAIYRIGFSGEAPELPGWFSEEARDFVGKCLVRDPRRRWTAAELLRHPFLDSAEELTPTSVVDQGFWDEFEVEEMEASPSPSDSPVGRIEALIGGGGPRWWDLGEDEEWLMVRANEVEDLNHDLIEEEEDIDSVRIGDDSGFDFWCGDCDFVTSSFGEKQSVNYVTYLILSILKFMSMELLFLHKLFTTIR
ncbi:mitogen-activated protein kinase kinase kinase 18 [Salvia hispanica]|uniref:mitogen-activated protein kinase kinase kinase 18 n=1 Tax=Salvia hispanica TaxID=49212 RepID=UPI0020092774|nr:mitogen-activated protein kinase kinase kinase 18 [Salvia hispanica]